MPAHHRHRPRDEFQPLANIPGVQLQWARSTATAWGPAVLQALFGASVPTLDTVFDGLAEFVDQHFDSGVLQSLLQS